MRLRHLTERVHSSKNAIRFQKSILHIPKRYAIIKPTTTKGGGDMKKQISVLLLFAICVLLFSSCSKMIVCNSIDTSFLNIAEKDGEMYIQSQFDDVYSIDFENKKMS